MKGEDSMETEYSALVAGEFVPALARATMKVVNPANGKVVGIVPECTVADMDRAVDAAYDAAPAWASMTIAERAKKLTALSSIVMAHHEELARLETMQYGGPLWKTTSFDIPTVGDMLVYMAGIARAKTGDTLPAGSECRAMTIREPLGVVGLITPWNFPLVTVIAKLAPALIMGNACVVKPPSVSPLTALKLGEYIKESGIPDGVVSIVTGPGGSVGEALVKNRKVAKIGFTGDSHTGKHIIKMAGDTVKPVTLELGGKNAFIVLPDANMDAVIEGAIWGSFFNSGQNCGSASRFIIHDSVYDEFVDRFVAAAKQITYGDTLKMDTMMGPVAYKAHRDSVERYIESAKNDGARLLLGGERPNTPETKDGYFVMPTVFCDCNNRMEFMQEEIFGPVVGLMRCKSPEEAVAITNDTRYGLCASIWTKDIRTGLIMTNQLKVGTVWLNQHLEIVFEIPWGGYKESGFGKENSHLVLDEYTALKHVWIDLRESPATPWQDRINF
jgi:acyl-CoA reductase-like NAD-dependent aldehyde dehydrogenase